MNQIASFGVAVLAATSWTQWARSGTCEFTDPARIEDPPFHLAYASWVSQRAGGVRYSRCVEVLNGQSARIDWRGTQARGNASPDRPVRFELDAVREQTEERPSRLEYGINKRPERGRDVNFLANISEVFEGASVVEARVLDWKLDAIAGKSVPQDILAPTSFAALGFDYLDKPFYLSASFTSFLDLEDRYSYELRYTLEGDGETEGLVLRPVSEGLVAALAQSEYKDGNIPLETRTEYGEPFQFSNITPITNPAERPSTQSVSAFEIVGAGEVLATFPVSYYRPRS